MKSEKADADLRAVRDDIYGVDTNTKKIREFWKPGGAINSENREKIDKCMREAGLATGPGTLGGLLTSASQAVDRAKVVECLGI